MEDLTLCKKCKSYVEGKCADYFEPGVNYPCVNFMENKDADKRRDD